MLPQSTDITASTLPSGMSAADRLIQVTTNKHFASDNYAGAHPEVLEAILKANHEHSGAYGNDQFTKELEQILKNHFGDDAHAFPVFNGTAANVISLQSVLPRWGAVICADSAHINVDEAGAPERVGGLKLLTVPAVDGKITPELIASRMHGINDVHRAQPLAVSISQVTELGTCYTPTEIQEIADFTHENGMVLHMDGSRLSNAAAHLGVSLRAITTDVGVDILSLGGTKNGALGAEAIVVLGGTDPQSTATTLSYLRKINLQLASKMRFISAQLVALYGTDLWLRSAEHANLMAERLSAGLQSTAVTTTRPRESNAVFIETSKAVAEAVKEHFKFYEWAETGEKTAEYRLMCSFDTTPEEVNELCDLFAEHVARQS